MIIGIIAEGSYPYIFGGVSNWLQQLIENMPDINFKILSIMPNQSDLPDYKYTIPKNVLAIDTVFMDGCSKSKFPLQRHNILTKDDINLLESFVNFTDDFDWSKLVRLLDSDKKKICPNSLLQGKAMWEHIVQRYERDFSFLGFNSYIWTVKSMLTPLLHFINEIDFEADFYHALSTGYAGIVGAALKSKYEKPLILTEHGMYVKEREQELKDIDWIHEDYKKLWIDFFYFMTKGCYTNSDIIISLYEGSSMIQKSHGAPPDKLQVIPNGVDIKRFPDSASPRKNMIIGSIIRVVPIKDVETMLRSFRIVLDYMPDVLFQIVGPYDEDKEYFDTCQSIAEDLSLTDHVVFAGCLDISTIINDIDILVFTSISEGQPLAILEGMASGIPIVATNVGDCPKLLLEDENEGPCGIITKNHSPDDTAKAIIRLIDDENLRKTIGYNGRHRIERNYNIEKVISSYRTIYESMK